MFVVGSTALREHGVKCVPRDLDIFGDFYEIRDFIDQLKKNHKIVSSYPINGGSKHLAIFEDLILEAEICWSDSTAKEFTDLAVVHSQITIEGQVFNVPDLNALLALKTSHRFLKNSPHFLKTMKDIHTMRKLGAHIPENLKQWFKRRAKETYNYSHPKLAQNKQNFFGEEDYHIYDHDTIHLSVMTGAVPSYTLFKSEQAEVWCDAELFAAQPLEVQLNAVLEEALVLALERGQIPFRGKASPEMSFKHALMKVCTSITSGWFRTFAWEHYYEVLALYPPTYVDKFWSDVESGLVKLHGHA